MKKAQISAPFQWGQNPRLLGAHIGGGVDCVTAFYAGVAGSSPTEKEQKFVPFSFIHNPPTVQRGYLELEGLFGILTFFGTYGSTDENRCL